MKRLTHAELAEAQAHGQWGVLWQAAIPLVKLTIGRMVRSGFIEPETADDDLLHEGYLIAGTALRTWSPVECAFGTHIKTWVFGELRNYLGELGTGGIASCKQSVCVLSTEDARGEQPPDDDSDDDGTFSAALTYGGVVLPGGQFDGIGEAPMGFRNPSEEVEKEIMTKELRLSLDRLTSEERAAVEALITEQGITVREFASRQGIPRSTAADRIKSARIFLGQTLPNFFS